MESIRVNHLGKAYKQYPNRWSRLLEWLFPFKGPRHHLKWVLQDIDIAVRSGEAVGIIGINGAGKSTLLKMITGTTQPTTGNVALAGTVAALLELGMGFHPDFTGRQNVFMAGQLLGLSVRDISRLMPEIEAFAEIGDYIDLPVRVYSSGMQVRLAFSVATARRPDVLIVDEALSVGDTYFQYKSFHRIREFRKAGTTLLIVSHDKQAIQSICDRAVLINNGRIEKEGDPAIVMDYYNALIIRTKTSEISIQKDEFDKNISWVTSGNGMASIDECFLVNSISNKVDVLHTGSQAELKIRVRINQDISRLILGYQIKDRFGQPVYGTNTQYTQQPVCDCKKGDVYMYSILFPASLGPGNYTISTSLTNTDGVKVFDNYEWREVTALFSVVNSSQPHFVGCAWLPSKISVTKL